MLHPQPQERQQSEEEKANRNKKVTLARLWNFPNKLYQLLEFAHSQNLELIVSWRSDGTSFSIKNEQDFMQQISPRFFPNQSTFRSFERQLNVWGFTRLSSSSSSSSSKTRVFFHPYFHQGKRELCRRIHRVENKGSKKTIQGGITVSRTIPETLKIHQQAALKFLQQKDETNSTISTSTSTISTTTSTGSTTTSTSSNHDTNVPDQSHDVSTIIGMERQPPETIANPNYYSSANLQMITTANQEVLWEEAFQALRTFLFTHGHCLVPDKYQPNPVLPIWARNQRMLRSLGLINQIHEAKLDAVGFVWEIASYSVQATLHHAGINQVQPNTIPSQSQSHSQQPQPQPQQPDTVYSQNYNIHKTKSSTNHP
jgi:hypothetical protein